MKKRSLSLIAILLSFMLLLCSCGEKNAPMNRDQAEKLVTNIMLYTNVFSEEMVKLGDNSLSNIFPFLDDSPWKVCYSGSSGVTADEFLIAEAPSQEKLEEYYSKIKSYIENRISQFSGYAPEETPKLESALIVKDGAYIIYIACKDTEAAQQAITDAKKAE